WTQTGDVVLHDVPAGGDIGCNPTHPSCDAGVTASNDCGNVTVNCSAGSITSSGCSRSQKFTYSAEACGHSASQCVTYNWTETTAPILAGLPAGGPLGCNPTPPSCCTTVTASNECGS